MLIRCYLFLTFFSCILTPIYSITLSPTTKTVLKTILEVQNDATINALYRSIMNGDTPSFASIITTTPLYLEKMATEYAHPNIIAVTVDNNATIRDLAMFDYFTDEMALETIERYLITHRTKPFIPNLQLVECFKTLLTLQLYADSSESDSPEEESITREDLNKAILAIVFYCNTITLQKLLDALDKEEESIKVPFHSSLLRLGIILEKRDIIEKLKVVIPNNTIIKPISKEILATAYTFFQQLYCSPVYYSPESE